MASMLDSGLSGPVLVEALAREFNAKVNTAMD